MRWSAVEKCAGDTQNLPVIQNDIEVINEVKTTMASRPLKKAKYAWQVKGRGKNGLSSSCTFGETPMCTDASASDVHSSETAEEMNVEEPHVDELRVAPSKWSSESASVSGLVSIPDVSSSVSPSLARTECADGSACSSLCSPNLVGVSRLSSFNSECMTVGVSPHSNVGAGSPINYALRRWQSKQLAQGIIDNAINKVLGDLGIPSHQNDIVNPNFNEPVNWGSYLNAQNIENEGVAEAIRQQGLQRQRFVQQPSLIGALCLNNNVSNEDSNAPFKRGVGSSVSRNSGDVLSSARAAATDMVDSIYKSSNQDRNQTGENDGPAAFSYRAGLLAQNNKYQTSEETNHLLNDVESLLQSDDLLNTAVSCAISEKGLGVLNVNE